jgi:RNA polymerase sigma factor (TIGR02999 family)
MAESGQNVTYLLQEWRRGDPQALDQLMPLVYDRLRAMAGSYLRSERPGHTLSTTAVVHEAFLRLVDTEVDWQDRAHFLAIAARVMRRVLVDHAKAHQREKRGGAPAQVSLDDVVLISPQASAQVQDLDEAITRLAAVDERKGRLLELFYFGGLSYEESAAAVGISEATVHRELKLAKAWIRHELAQGV